MQKLEGDKLSLPLQWDGMTSNMPIYSLEGNTAQLYVKPFPYYNGDTLYYSCSTLLEISPDPLAFWDYLIEAVNTSGTGSIIFDFILSIEYSSTAFVEGEVELPKIDPTSFTPEERA